MGATATVEGENFSNIVEMIEELTQPDDTEFLKISIEVASISTTSVAEESSQPIELPEDLSSTSRQPGKTSGFDNLTLGIVTDIVVMATYDIALTQAEEPIMGTGVEDIPVDVSTGKVLIVEPVLEVTIHEIITAPNPKASVMTSEMRQLLTHLAPAFWEGQVFHLRLLRVSLLQS